MEFLKPRAALAATLALGALACVPDVDTDESTVTGPRVLAVIAEPAEAKPRDSVQYSALLVDQDGVRDQGVLAWFYCLAQKPLAELGPIDRDCLSPQSGKLTKIGSGFGVEAQLPSDACALFGPNVPLPEPGQPPGRPVDPDQTGGYAQPVMLGFNTGDADSIVLYEQRIQCDLAGVTPALGVEYKQRYHANRNPSLSELRVQRANGESVSLAAGDTLEVQAGEQLQLDARWVECPAQDVCGDGVCGPDETRVDCSADCAQPQGCQGQERYLWFNNESRALQVRRESMRLSWYATAGTYRDERTGVDEDDFAQHSENGWTAPNQSSATLWVVLRDARTGVGTFQLDVQVR